jgi:PKD repeat protein
LSNLYKQGMQFFKDGDYEQASELFVSLLESDGRHHKAWNALGVCLTKLEDFDQALTCFDNAVKLCPDNQIYKKNLESLQNKIVDKPALPIQFRRLKDIKQFLSKIKTDSADYACFILGCLLMGIIFIAPAVGFIIQSPANEIIGFSAVLFYCFFLFSVIIRNLVYLGLRLRHVIYGIVSLGCISLVVILFMYPHIGFPVNGTEKNTTHTTTIPIGQINNPPTNIPVETITETPEQNPTTDITQIVCTIPKASFKSQFTDYDPFQISFFDTSDTLVSNIKTRKWDFGDGSSSMEEKPVHTYSGLPKAYPVTLTVWNACNQSNNTTMMIDPGCQIITPNIVAHPKIGIVPLTVSFVDITGPLGEDNSWQWAFGDGQVKKADKTQRNTSYTYTKMGIYHPTLTITNRCKQSQSATTSITVQGKGIISGKLWVDENVNEAIDVGERNLSNWQIILEREEDGEWKGIQLTSTDFEGKYNFSILDTGGVYRIRELIKPGYWITTGDTEQSNISEPFALFEPNIHYFKNFGHKRYDFDKFHEITFSSSRKGTISEGSHMQWIQNGVDGYAHINGTKYELKNKDRCAIQFLEKSGNANISITGDIHATHLENVSLSINGIIRDKGFCDEIRSSMIQRYDSDLDIIIEPEKSSYCNLIWDRNNTPVEWRKELIIHDIIPQSFNKMNLVLDKNYLFIDGRAASYEIK